MRTERVVTNLRCNQNCTYCTNRSAEDEPAFVRKAAVERRIAALAARNVAELVITGGEPTLRQDLIEIVTGAARTFESVVLETNATRIDQQLATALAAAGLGLARVNLSGWGPGLDAVTRDPGGFEATRAGLCALRAAGIRIEIAAVVVRSTQALLPQLPAGLVDTLGDVSTIRAIDVAIPTASPDASEILPYEAVVATITALDRAAREVGIPVHLAADSGLPPCVFPPQQLVPHLFSLTTGGSRRDNHAAVPACDRCLVADRCSGFARANLDRYPLPTLHPIGDDRTRRRLSIISTVAEQMERELVSPNLYRTRDDFTLHEDVIRVAFRCNQACRFCFVSTHLPTPDDDAVEQAIRAAAARRAKITLSGGEPTLHPRLVDYVRLASSLSEHPVQLQTNAVRLDDSDLVEALAKSGMSEVFVSLHGSTAEISDAVTRAPGTFVRTLQGLDNLHRADIQLLLNFVICRRNAADLPAIVRLIAERWPTVPLTVSFVAPSTDVVPRDRDMIPRYTDVLPHIADALAEGNRLGVRIDGFQSMCGVPLCLVPTGLQRYFASSELPPGFDDGEFLKPAACDRCALATRCFGIRRGYAELHGTSELTPVSELRR